MLPGWTTETFEHQGLRRPVLRAGRGPGVLVMHEIPTITPEVAAFGRRLVDEGYAVAMPVMLGTPGRPRTVGTMARSMARACIAREFHVLASRRSSPLTTWLRALCRWLHGEQGGPGVGAIGMCLTGNFALALALEPAMLAPVLCQPSLPFGLTRSMRAALHVSDQELAALRERGEREALRVLGLRFTGDRLCPPERFETLRRELGERFEGIEIDSSPGNAHGIGRFAHSVVTNDLVDEAGHPTREALERLLAFLHRSLRPHDAREPGSAPSTA
ncbi:MAG: dienelactone hydrolase family protein [Myxococcales bacterium]|nr:dienelactone hydrolase family protein [Myxococcales bacterium]